MARIERYLEHFPQLSKDENYDFRPTRQSALREPAFEGFGSSLQWPFSSAHSRATLRLYPQLRG
jgi:hypothetical protein